MTARPAHRPDAPLHAGALPHTAAAGSTRPEPDAEGIQPPRASVPAAPDHGPRRGPARKGAAAGPAGQGGDGAAEGVAGHVPQLSSVLPRP
ncbi:hypothetical protein ACFZA1_32470 [Streptomyces filipinensis]|uniref:hypothetical protein n=1 Tax=Streptomyces filipinensis TaxID=66887 RepID=UPI0036E9C8E9